MNKAILLGRLGQEPRQQNNCCSFTIATTERYTDKQGQKQSKTTWHVCVIFGKGAEVFVRYAGKGSRVLLEGRLENNEYTDKNGAIVKSMRVLVDKFEFCDSKQKDDNTEVNGNKAAKEFFGDESEIPF